MLMVYNQFCLNIYRKNERHETKILSRKWNSLRKMKYYEEAGFELTNTQLNKFIYIYIFKICRNEELPH